MLTRLASLRGRLLLSMLAAACVGLLGSYLLISRLQHEDERSADRQKALTTARAVARALARGATQRDLAAMQAVLPDDRIFVIRRGRTVYEGPVNRHDLELAVTVPFTGGQVRLFDHKSTSPSGALGLRDLTLIGVGLTVFLLGIASVADTVLLRALRRPIEQATATARRVAAGDLGARIGALDESEFADLAATFDELVARFERSDRDQRQFLADVAHEIATPVHAIRGFAGALADGTMASETERDEAFALIDSQSRRIDSLLNDLRELTHLDLAQPLHAEAVDVAALCRTAVARFSVQAAEAGVDLRAEQVASPRRFVSDPRLLETILDNLLSNAIRHTPTGGNVRLSSTLRGDRLTLAVKDTGAGIAAEHRKRVFERFYRVEDARDRGTGGSGLGLALAQRAAHSLGGHIEVDSQPAAGSEFRLVLPLARQDPQKRS